MKTKHINSLRFSQVCSVVFVEALLWIIYKSCAYGQHVSSTSFNCSGNDTCALLQFRDKLSHRGEPALASWSSTDVRHWKGVTWRVDSHGEYHASKLELGGFQLSIKSGIQNIAPLLSDGLTSLQVLNLSGNLFNVTLPRTLRVCSTLQVLDLSNSSFYGFLPHHMECDDYDGQQSDVPNMVTHMKLRVFNVSQNNFTGEVPESLFSYDSAVISGVTFGNLSCVNLAGNSFKGRIPYSFANCTSLTELNLSSNSFTVPLHELGKLPLLQTLDFSANSLSGSLQTVIGIGGFRNLRYLALRDNGLTGSLPRNVGNLSSLEVLDLASNLLTGMVQVEVGNMSRLKTLDPSHNGLVGTLPGSLGKLSLLESLILSRNNLTGNIPRGIFKLTNLRTLNLYHNYLNGTIASDFSHLTSLEALNLAHNYIAASASVLAPLVTNCTKLRILWLGVNFISGELPPDVRNATNLRVLSLYGNKLEGGYPPNCGN